MSQMLKSSGAMGAATLTSRVLGMVREMAYSHFMADSWVAGAFTLAFTIPSLFRRLLGEGALTAAFIPIFKEKEKNAGEAEMWRAANAVLSGLVVVASAIVALSIVGISVALAFGVFTVKTRLMLELLRVMFPYMLLVCIAAVFMGMLNARGHFFIPAMGATMLNIVMITSVLWLAPRMGTTLEQQIFGLAIGVVVAGCAQALFQMPLLRREGFRLQWVSPWRNETVQRVARTMIAGTFGIAAIQINVALTQGLAFWVDPQIVASFSYAVRLMELPQGVFGISLATYLLPTLSGLALEKKFADFRATLAHGLSHLIFVNLLASVLLVVLAEPIIRLLFEHGQFGPDASARAGFALACLAPGLLAFSIVNILARAFYALGDVQTPMRISVFCLAMNLLFVLWLVPNFAQGGLGIANTLSAGLNVYLLFYALRRKLEKLELAAVQRTLVPLMFASALAGVTTWFVHRTCEQQFQHVTLVGKLVVVFVPMFAATVVYLSATLLLKIPTAHEMCSLVGKKFTRTKV